LLVVVVAGSGSGGSSNNGGNVVVAVVVVVVENCHYTIPTATATYISGRNGEKYFLDATFA